MHRKGSLVPVLDRNRSSSLAEYVDLLKEERTQFMAAVEDNFSSSEDSGDADEDGDDNGYDEADMYMPGFSSKRNNTSSFKKEERPVSFDSIRKPESSPFGIMKSN